MSEKRISGEEPVNHEVAALEIFERLSEHIKVWGYPRIAKRIVVKLLRNMKSNGDLDVGEGSMFAKCYFYGHTFMFLIFVHEHKITRFELRRFRCL